MARPSSKILSIAEKKEAIVGLKTAIKSHKAEVSAVNATYSEAVKVLASAKKAADVAVTAANKAQAAAVKEAGKALAAAQKVFDGVEKKYERASEAAAKGTEKLATQLATVEAIEPAAKVKVPKGTNSVMPTKLSRTSAVAGTA